MHPSVERLPRFLFSYRPHPAKPAKPRSGVSPVLPVPWGGKSQCGLPADRPPITGDRQSGPPGKTGETSEFSPLWSELSLWRWAPAVGDPTPELVIGPPDLAPVSSHLEPPAATRADDRTPIVRRIGRTTVLTWDGDEADHLLNDVLDKELSEPTP